MAFMKFMTLAVVIGAFLVDQSMAEVVINRKSINKRPLNRAICITDAYCQSIADSTPLCDRAFCDNGYCKFFCGEETTTTTPEPTTTTNPVPLCWTGEYCYDNTFCLRGVCEMELCKIPCAETTTTPVPTPSITPIITGSTTPKPTVDCYYSFTCNNPANTTRCQELGGVCTGDGKCGTQCFDCYQPLDCNNASTLTCSKEKCQKDGGCWTYCKEIGRLGGITYCYSISRSCEFCKQMGGFCDKNGYCVSPVIGCWLFCYGYCKPFYFLPLNIFYL